jgi:predicted DNA-binding protein (MmcQ/YjbR family)
MSARPTAVAAHQTALMSFALALPEAYEDQPWGDTVTKVRNKIFVFWGGQADTVAFSVKLLRSHGYALSLPYAKPTGYGLGKSGWVSFQTTDPTVLEVPLVKEWIVESYRAVAPKKLAALVDVSGGWHNHA